MKFTDCAPHVDDVCMAVSMMNEDSPLPQNWKELYRLHYLFQATKQVQQENIKNKPNKTDTQ